MSSIKRIGLALMLVAGVLVLAACSVKKLVPGEWKVQNGFGYSTTMTISKKTITIDDKEYSYKQIGSGFKNKTRYVSMIINDDDYYSIVFPADDKELAIMIKLDDKDEPLKGTMVYAMNKNKTPNYDDYVDKYFSTK